MSRRLDCIKNCEELKKNETFSYPGDKETFGTTVALGRQLGLERVAINYEVLAPGDRSSWPHAHKEEEEFIYILEGTPQIWIDGLVYDLSPGDCVGLPPGTGQAHTLLNNSDKEVKAIVVGEGETPTDKIFYPMHPARNEEMKDQGLYWENRPEIDRGKHDGQTDLKKV
ncbi:MAG: cupin domain-containing protein [Bacteriovoracaceae bacterium]|jgi:uncharacterized cupin superfamily protein|nr:cupin domain-containing protein [Bacteriovoracaceae bacterium]